MTGQPARRRRPPTWLTYTLLRLLFLAVPFVVVYGLSANWLLAAVIASVVALALSVIFLNRQRTALGQDLAAFGARKHTVDESVEDAVADERDAGAGQSTSAAASPKP